MENRIILILGILLLIVMILTLFAGIFFYNLSVNRNVSKEAVFDDRKNSSSQGIKQNETSGEHNEVYTKWILKESNYEDIYIKSFDNLKLHAYKILNEENSDKWVIIVHGYTGEGLRMGSRAKKFYDMGYNIIIPDLRGHGTSEGNYIGMGWHDRKDMIEWINFIVKEDDCSKIILYGISMGASTVMMTAGENLPQNVKLIIEDCGYTSVWDEFSYQLKCMYKLPTFPIMHMASIITKIRAGYTFTEASALNQIKKCKLPILFIHGDKDNFVPYYMHDRVYDAANCFKEKLIIKEAGHCKGDKVNPELYWNTIEKFIEKYN
ncbi:alpha/beta hydrolase [Clostridium botulinum]|uniref:alpha/beta hydrolase n=1 Tax=Clostridium botulinum TaxID=1491 RepID=UPI000772EA6F|nr:alpha/beta hydrolase [Clostridium botulinum]NFL87610.1 alpha/beta hydrolase [Clostridium botulinum]NFO20326.1 alpha/beta hydrolase [Clostridium botulinum]